MISTIKQNTIFWYKVYTFILLQYVSSWKLKSVEILKLNIGYKFSEGDKKKDPYVTVLLTSYYKEPEYK